jgi:hypothetical protein
VEVIGEITMNAMSVVPSLDNSASLHANLTVQILSPLGPACPLNVHTFGMPCGKLLYQGHSIGSLSIDQRAASTDSAGSLAVAFTSQLLVDPQAFAAFLSDVLNTDTLIVALQGVLGLLVGLFHVHDCAVCRQLAFLKWRCFLTCRRDSFASASFDFLV